MSVTASSYSDLSTYSLEDYTQIKHVIAKLADAGATGEEEVR